MLSGMPGGIVGLSGGMVKTSCWIGSFAIHPSLHSQSKALSDISVRIIFGDLTFGPYASALRAGLTDFGAMCGRGIFGLDQSDVAYKTSVHSDFCSSSIFFRILLAAIHPTSSRYVLSRCHCDAVMTVLGEGLQPFDSSLACCSACSMGSLQLMTRQD